MAPSKRSTLIWCLVGAISGGAVQLRSELRDDHFYDDTVPLDAFLDLTRAVDEYERRPEHKPVGAPQQPAIAAQPAIDRSEPPPKPTAAEIAAEARKRRDAEVFPEPQSPPRNDPPADDKPSPELPAIAAAPQADPQPEPPMQELEPATVHRDLDPDKALERMKAAYRKLTADQQREFDKHFSTLAADSTNLGHAKEAYDRLNGAGRSAFKKWLKSAEATQKKKRSK